MQTQIRLSFAAAFISTSHNNFVIPILHSSSVKCRTSKGNITVSPHGFNKELTLCIVVRSLQTITVLSWVLAKTVVYYYCCFESSKQSGYTIQMVHSVIRKAGNYVYKDKEHIPANSTLILIGILLEDSSGYAEL